MKPFEHSVILNQLNERVKSQVRLSTYISFQATNGITVFGPR